MRLISRISAIGAALLAFTCAERASLAQTFAPPPPPPMEFHPKPDSTVWMLGSLDFVGFGSGRLGAIFAGFGGETHVWLTKNVGLGGRVSAYAAGAPDSGASNGLMLGGTVSLRTKVVERTRQSGWLWATLGGGSIGFDGYDRSPSDVHFHERAAFVSARFGYLGEYGPLAYGMALEAIVAPGNGLAVSPIFFGGLAF